MFFIAVANEKYDEVVSFYQNEETGEIKGTQVLPDVEGAKEIVENMRSTLEKYGLEYRPVDTDIPGWENNPMTKDEKEANCIILHDAIKKQMENAFKALRIIA